MDKLKKEGETLSKEIKKKIATYIIASFGLVTGLAWNEAVKSLIEYLFPINRDTFLVKIIYAIIITSILAFITIYFTKLFINDSDEKKDKL